MQDSFSMLNRLRIAGHDLATATRAVLIVGGLGLMLGACAEGRDYRGVGSFLYPLCAKDGSVVFVQYTNAQGNYENTEASRENCKNANQ